MRVIVLMLLVVPIVVTYCIESSYIISSIHINTIGTLNMEKIIFNYISRLSLSIYGSLELSSLNPLPISPHPLWDLHVKTRLFTPKPENLDVGETPKILGLNGVEQDVMEKHCIFIISDGLLGLANDYCS